MAADIANLPDLLRRRRAAVEAACLQVRAVPPGQSAQWDYSAEAITHHSGGFFRIIGLRHSRAGVAAVTQPIIDQPEIGVLGLVVRTAWGGPLLVQFKAEPGTTGDVQMAPTCQATRSNLARRHGGTAPPGAEWFRHPAAVVSGSLQSEQGTRFWKKRNRNLVVVAPGTGGRHTRHMEPQLAWVTAATLQRSLAEDFLVNTDLRSVLATAPWALTAGRFDHTRSPDPLARAVARSWHSQTAHDAEVSAARVRRWLSARRRFTEMRASLIPLSEVHGLRRSSRGLSWTGRDGAFAVRHLRVHVRGRECDSWDQPLVTSPSDGQIVLPGFQIGRTWRFLFRATAEPGLRRGVELHPAILRAPGMRGAFCENWLRDAVAAGQVWRTIRQSDEGGRFWHDVTTYSVVAVGAPRELPDDLVALSPREIECLAPGGVFTNEARSTISLLLSTVS